VHLVGTLNENIDLKWTERALSWVRRLVAGLSPWRFGFDPGSVHVGFVVDKVALGQCFGFPLSVSLHRFSIKMDKQTKLIIFITGLHSKPQGCGASVASAAGSFSNKKIHRVNNFKIVNVRHSSVTTSFPDEGDGGSLKRCALTPK
jgi:hypothetical protein